MSHQHDSEKLKEGEALPWPAKFLLFSLALLLGFLDHAFHGWGRTVFSAGIALAAPIVGYRRLWGERRFWWTVALLVGIQIPLAIGMRPLLETSRLPGMLAFAAIDCAVATLTIAWVCS
jgi:hypothetical protein